MDKREIAWLVLVLVISNTIGHYATDSIFWYVVFVVFFLIAIGIAHTVFDS